MDYLITSSDSDSECSERPTKKVAQPKSRKRKIDSDEDFDPTTTKAGPSKRRKPQVKKTAVLGLDTSTKPKRKLKEPKLESEVKNEIFSELHVDKHDQNPHIIPTKECASRSVKTSVAKVKNEVKTEISSELDSDSDGQDQKLNTGIKPQKLPAPKPKRTKNIKELKSENLPQMEWDVAETLACIQKVDVWAASNIIDLFKGDNTIPFIARYRKEQTGDIGAEKLRDIKETYELLENVKQRASTVMSSVQKLGKLTPVLEKSICCARTLSEIDHIYAPYKPGSKGTKAERARQLGLEELATSLLDGTRVVNLYDNIQPNKDGLKNEAEVSAGIQHIIADIISKDQQVLKQLRELKDHAYIKLESSKARETKLTSKKIESKTKASQVKVEHRGETREDLERKFENYLHFSVNVKFIKPHQMLAINRGENLKVLSVKVIFPDRLIQDISAFCRRHFMNNGMHYSLREELIELSIKDAYTRLLQPLLTRQVRADLNSTAVHAAVEVFATNLKSLLLSPPLRGSTILGIDPGFRNGCKIGVISSTGEVLHTDVIYPRFGSNIPPPNDPNACKIKDLLTNFNCQLVALGNGTACRETETYLSNLIQCRWFAPLDITYTIVSEQGASIYSCGTLAKKEFPQLDPNVISAVSLARRVQDPLGELVKVEPQHLGVGMYQHDVPKKQLNSTLDEVVVECVSFVGVDINTASVTLLKHVAGLNSARADKILEWRAKNGPFVNRLQLKQVKGIGEKTFEQCAGFIRIIPETAHGNCDTSNKEVPKRPTKKIKLDSDVENPLDRTWIHPESYVTADKFIRKCGVARDTLGTTNFIEKVNKTVLQEGLTALAKELSIAEPLMKLISDGLQQRPGEDLRSQSKQPLFRRGLTSMEDLRPGTKLTGRAVNVTHFGVFVDVGVGTDGLIPTSKLANIRVQLGDRVEVDIVSIEMQRKRICLHLIQVL